MMTKICFVRILKEAVFTYVFQNIIPEFAQRARRKPLKYSEYRITYSKFELCTAEYKFRALLTPWALNYVCNIDP
jgi:hypothetical protein